MTRTLGLKEAILVTFESLAPILRGWPLSGHITVGKRSPVRHHGSLKPRLVRALPDSHIILGGQSTVCPVVAIEAVFHINAGLSYEVVGTHKVMVKHGHGQLWLSWE